MLFFTQWVAGTVSGMGKSAKRVGSGLQGGGNPGDKQRQRRRHGTILHSSRNGIETSILSLPCSAMSEITSCFPASFPQLQMPVIGPLSELIFGQLRLEAVSLPSLLLVLILRPPTRWGFLHPGLRELGLGPLAWRRIPPLHSVNLASIRSQRQQPICFLGTNTLNKAGRPHWVI